jgi:cell division protein FtsI (penicillin-binding protein 3)
MIKGKQANFAWRYYVVLGMLGLLGLALAARMIYLQVMHKQFLKRQGDMRSIRTVELEALRGIITDRNGEPLAVSTPVDSIWAVPDAFDKATPNDIQALAEALELPQEFLKDRLRESLSQHKEFVYLKRQMEPSKAKAALALKVPGVNVTREYRRYYPGGEASAHVIGAVNLDGKGVEGLELAYDKYLTGSKGSKRVLKDRRGHIIQDLQTIQAAQQGGTIQLTIDNRLQYLAYRALKNAVTKHAASGGSVVLLDVDSGEILAMVNQPSYNPNNRRDYKPNSMRNRAITDVFEPGSVMKTFSIMSALQAGTATPDMIYNTAPGELPVGRNTVKDIHNYGSLNLRGILRKSSNVGTVKVIQEVPQEALIDLYRRLGFGSQTAVEFPGERAGQLDITHKLDAFTYATLAFGYRLSATPLQIAKAYAIIAADGMSRPVTLIKQNANQPAIEIIDPSIARIMRDLLLIQPNDGGSGQAGRVRGYNISGKSGTARKVGETGYMEDSHIGTFVGMAPLEHPRLVCLVVIDNPTKGDYYGGAVAAPVFGEIMAGALRLMDIPLDNEKAYDKAGKTS